MSSNNINIFPMKLRGNIKRIDELAEKGQKANAISGTFKDNGIIISPEFVQCILNGELKELDRQAMPKSVVKNTDYIGDMIWES